MSDLSVNARAMCATTFLCGAKSSVTFHMPSRIGPECKAALDELVEAGVITLERLNDISPALVYRGSSQALGIGRKFMHETRMADWPSFPITME